MRHRSGSHNLTTLEKYQLLETQFLVFDGAGVLRVVLYLACPGIAWINQASVMKLCMVETATKANHSSLLSSTECMVMVKDHPYATSVSSDNLRSAQFLRSSHHLLVSLRPTPESSFMTCRALELMWGLLAFSHFFCAEIYRWVTVRSTCIVLHYLPLK